MSALLTPVMLAALLLPAASAHLDKCRALEAEFDYQAMVDECTQAAADPNISGVERIEINRLLGFAHTALGDEDIAEVWFLRLLTLDPTHELPNEVSPRFRGAFAKAKERFEKEGKVVVTHDPPAAEAVGAGVPSLLSFRVVDKLGRVASASVQVEVVTDDGASAPEVSALERVDTGVAGQVQFDGQLTDPTLNQDDRPASYSLRYRLKLLNAMGGEVSPEPAFEPAAIEVQGAVGGGGGGGSDTDLLLWAGLATVGGVVLVAAVAGGSAALYCTTVGCGAPQVQAPVGYVAVEIQTAGLGGSP